MGRIRSILESTDGFVSLKITAENTIRITFEDQKTNQQKIIDSLVQGGVAVPGKP